MANAREHTLIPTPRRTNVYVDAFNLYYGCLKKTSYKWLDIVALCRHSVPPHYQVNQIRYFTARVQPRPTDPQQAQRQQIYIRALETLPNLVVHYGHYLSSHVRMPLVNPPPHTVEVIKTEEKGSDVNLATYLLIDAFRDTFDAAIVISDDSDLTEPIRIVRQDFKRHITILSPRGQSQQLRRTATRFYTIQAAALQKSQFPNTLRDATGVFTKPPHW